MSSGDVVPGWYHLCEAILSRTVSYPKCGCQRGDHFEGLAKGERLLGLQIALAKASAESTWI